MFVCQYFNFLRAERATRQRRLLLTRYTWIQASSASLETLIATWYVQWDANRSILTTTNKCLFANFLLFASGEGDEVASPSFTTRYVPIEPSSVLLETFTASWYM